MEGKETTPEKIFVIDIKLNRGLVVVLSCLLVLAALLSVLTLTGDSASASETEAAQAAFTGMRQWYLTQGMVDGQGGLDACADGYHMASLWEIADPSNLQYNTTLGRPNADSGEGPPTGEVGWVRTGYVSSSASTAGRANCDAWTSNTSGDYGTVAILPMSWVATPGEVGVWDVEVIPCYGFDPVWCIED